MFRGTEVDADRCAIVQESESAPQKPLLEPEAIPEFDLDALEITEDDPNFAEYKRIAERFKASNVSTPLPPRPWFFRRVQIC